MCIRQRYKMARRCYKLCFFLAAKLFLTFYIFIRPTTVLRYDIQSEIDNSVDPSPDSNIISPSALSAHLWSQNPSSISSASFPSSYCPRLTNGTKNLLPSLHSPRRWKPKNPHTDESILRLVSNCKDLFDVAKFSSNEPSKEELEFPLAYVFVAARNAAQTLRLFRLLYQRHNLYCIAYDAKSDPVYIRFIRALASCFPDNVMLIDRPESIYYSDYTLLSSIQTCLRQLIDYKNIQWRYVQIISYNDFPLKTNLEMVKIFSMLNDTNDCTLVATDPTRFFVNYHNRKLVEDYKTKKSVIPHGLRLYKSNVGSSLTRAFVEFLFESEIARDLFLWLNGTRSAEEFYWATLIYNVHLNAPGHFPGSCEPFYTHRDTSRDFISRYHVWNFDHTRSCYGQMHRLSCIFGIGDLPVLIRRPELIGHKFYDDYQPMALFCLEQWYWNKVINGIIDLDNEYYINLPGVRYQRLENKNEFVC